MATAELNTAPGARARNQDGSFASIPHELALDVSDTLLSAVALMQCGRREIPIGGMAEGLSDELHDPTSRASVLIAVAEEKVRKALLSLSPYV